MVHYLRAKLAPIQPGTLPFAYRELLQGLIHRLPARSKRFFWDLKWRTPATLQKLVT